MAVDGTKKQNILIVHNYYQIPGGEDTVVANEKKILEKHGHKVILYSRNNAELKQMSKFQKLFLPITTVFNPRTYKEIKRLIKSEKIEIVHVHNTLNLISPAVYYAARAMKVPVVQTVHNFRLLCPGATFYRDGHICEDCVKSGLWCAIKHKCYRGSRMQTLACAISTWFHRMTGIYGKINYICLTEFNKSKLLELKQIRPEQIYVKPNFIVKKQKGYVLSHNREQQFVYFGRIDKLKGIDVLIEAWKLLGKNAPKLVICGTGPLEEWCKTEIQKNQLKNVKYLGFVPNDKVIEIVARSKAVILPTQWYEGFPMTIIEAYSVGTPVIGSNIGNVDSLIQEGITGYHIQYDSAESIAYVVENADFDLCGRIYDYYIKHYSSDENYIILKNIYKTVS